MQIVSDNKHNIGYKSNIYSRFTSDLTTNTAGAEDSFEKNIQKVNINIPKEQKSTLKKVGDFAIFIAITAIALVGIKKLWKMPTTKSIELTNLLDKKSAALKEITSKLKDDIKKIYEEKNKQLKKLLSLPDNINKKNIQNHIDNIKSSKSLEEILKYEDEAINDVYKWYKGAMPTHKNLAEFLVPAENIQNSLFEEIKQLKKSALEKIDKTMILPEKFKNGRNIKRILKEFNSEKLSQEKRKTERIEWYVRELFKEDGVALFNKYNDRYDELVGQKNLYVKNILDEALKIRTSYNNLTRSNTNLISQNNLLLPESIKSNQFIKFVQESMAKEKSPKDYLNFIESSIGKDLSYKDIEIIENRLILRSGLAKENDLLLSKTNETKKNFLKFFEKNAEKKAEGIDFNNLSDEEFFSLLEKANILKEKYGIGSLRILPDIKKRPAYCDTDTLLFKLNSKILNNRKTMGDITGQKLDRYTKYFTWGEIE